MKRQSSDKPDSDIDEKKIRTSSDIALKTSKYFSDAAEDCTDTGSDSDKVDSESFGRLTFKSFDRPCTDLAKALLGKKFVRKLESGNVLEAIIVETEAYLGGEDKAAHSYKGKRTQRNEAMFMKPGTIYVYSIYGMYTCINISSQGI